MTEIAIFALLTAKDINDTIHVIVDYKASICSYNVTKCDVTDTLLPHATEVNLIFTLRNALNDRSAEHNIM